MELTAAFVLHQRPYRETSLLLDIFSHHHGRVSLVAKGQRQNKKRQQNPFQLFQPLWLNWFGNGDLVTLKQVEVLEPAYQLTGQNSLCGLYLNELLVRLLPLHVAETEVFEHYQQALLALEQNQNEQIILRLFEKRLLNYLGYGLCLDVEVDTHQAIDGKQHYIYQPEYGLRRYNNPTNGISGRSLQHLQQESGFDEQSLKEIKHMMRGIIDFHLGGRPLRSRQLFAELNQFKTSQ